MASRVTEHEGSHLINIICEMGKAAAAQAAATSPLLLGTHLGCISQQKKPNCKNSVL